jgi:hypothetical protein
MRLWWVLLLCVLIVSGTVRSARSPKVGSHDDKDNNGDDNGSGNDGTYLALSFIQTNWDLKKRMIRSPF